jgi:O-antigen ligase
MLERLIKKINNFLLFLFVFTLPLMAFSIFKFGEKDIIFSWALILLIGLLNIQRFKKINRAVIFLFMWFFVLILTEMNLGAQINLSPSKIFFQLINIGIMMIHVIVLCAILRDKKFEEIENITKILFFSTLVFIFYGFYQYSTYFLTFLPKLDIFRNASIYNIYSGTGKEGWIGTYRISSVAPEPSCWAFYLLIPLCFFIPYIFSLKKFWWKKFYFLLFLISFILTFSRSGFIVLFIVFLISPLIIRKIPPKLKIVYVSTILIFFVLGIFGIYRGYLRLPMFSDLSFYERLYSQEIAFRVFYRNPVLGVGFGNFQNFIENNFPPLTSSSLIVTHNFFLRILAETGLVGFCFFILFLFYINIKIKKAKLIIDEIGDMEKRRFIEGLELCFFSIVISWLFFPGYNFSYIWFIFSLALIMPQILKNKNLNII